MLHHAALAAHLSTLLGQERIVGITELHVCSFRLERLTDGLSLNDHGKLVDPACLGDLKDSFGASRVSPRHLRICALNACASAHLRLEDASAL